MAIGFVELQGSIPRQQDFQIIKQNEDSKVHVDQNNYQIENDKQIEQSHNQVNKQDDTSASKDGNENNKDAYNGDGGIHRKNKNKTNNKQDEIIDKKKMKSSFDFRI